MAEKVRVGLTHWMRPPEGQPTEEGLIPGDAGYVDPHAEAMEEWRGIDKQGSFGPDGEAPLKGRRGIAGVGRVGGRVAPQGRKQMVTGSTSGTILAP